MSSEEGFKTVVIGAGQAGLASGYYLRQRGDRFIILDESVRIGTSWRNRWDSLHLFTIIERCGERREIHRRTNPLILTVNDNEQLQTLTQLLA